MKNSVEIGMEVVDILITFTVATVVCFVIGVVYKICCDRRI